jgi:hypothetical protein
VAGIRSEFGRTTLFRRGQRVFQNGREHRLHIPAHAIQHDSKNAEIRALILFKTL